MPTSRKIILSLNITKSIFASYNPKPIIIEFNSITEAEQKLGIDKSSIHKMLEENRELEGILAIIQGTMGFEKHTDKQNNKINKRENDKEKMIKHLQAKANYCKKHKVNYVKTLTQCPLCKLDEAKKKFKML